MTATDTDTDIDVDAGVPRLDLSGLFPDGYRAMLAFDRAVGRSDLDGTLLNLVKQRASQINGCAYCLDMHAKDARSAGESQQRLDVLSAWREVPLFTELERAALGLTEAITLVAGTHVPDEVVDAARAHFTPEELAQLVFHVVTINAWNRIAITARMPLPPPA
ncbi:MAG TPA: carboxymuconolactone decarboxylase family protein [Acidimicrobiales bacterium]